MTLFEEGGTMLTLLILRHAKSSWDDPNQDDYDRPLNKRGRKEAKSVGKFMRERKLLPDVVLTSTAERARQTVELWQLKSHYLGPIEMHREFYLAGPERYLEALAELGTQCSIAMVVGHNPGLEELVLRLTGEPAQLSTAALVEVQLPHDSWDRVGQQAAVKLANIWRVKESNGE
jgi:phosphohistidine phosphatase